MAKGMRFKWDPKKSESNLKKHGINFETAKLVFDDLLCVTEYEGDEHGEPRWRTTGQIGGFVVVRVSHTIREEGETEVIRIITARKAGRGERQEYEGASRPHR